MTTIESRWRARWKAIAKYYRRFYRHPVTDFCPNCEATERRKAELEAERWRLRTALAKQNHEISQIFARALGYPKFSHDQKNFPGATEQDGCAVGDHVAETLAVEAAQEIERLKAELEHLRTLATLAAGFCAENVGLEITENGRRLREAVGEWSRATAGDELEPGEYQRTADPDC